MKITKIKVRNFRLLKDFSIDLEDSLSLVVGKNNCGKTSILLILDKFLNNKKFKFEDFNLDFKKGLKDLLTDPNEPDGDFDKFGLSLKLFIKYEETDNLKNINKLMMDLDPEENKIELLFEYKLSIEAFKKLKEDYRSFKKEPDQENEKEIDFFLKEKHGAYFKTFKKTLDLEDPSRFIDLEKEKITLENIINYQYIRANRSTSNNDNNKSLSGLSSSIYDNMEADDGHQIKIKPFKDELYKTDESLSAIYKSIFQSSIDKVEKFGGLNPKDTQIAITSTLQHKDLLKGNTTVLYKHNNDFLPEHYNGLGYMNLISIIFEIEIIINAFKRSSDQEPADLNLLFIEEPEAHTHPQMQYVFIKNIKELLLEEADLKGKLQYIITTHSSHIVSESDFEDIKYLKRVKGEGGVVSNNLKDLKKEYKEENYKFLKQYLTLHRAELFFADKAIFIEGDTERILLPAMMKKIDQENPEKPLLSQNISIIETGAYSHIFEKFIDFIGIKSLVITDIDSADESCRKCRVTDKDAQISTNASLAYYYRSKKLKDFKGKEITNMTLEKNSKTGWEKSPDGFLVCVYQTEQKNTENIGYHARSFEDAFFHINRQFIIDDVNKAFQGETKKGLKNIKKFLNKKVDAYALAEDCVNRKPALALEILLNSKDEKNTKGDLIEFSNWKTPEYINKGLLWLKE